MKRREKPIDNEVVKRNTYQSGNGLKCNVCNFDFYETYGELGKGFIECHQTIPVSEYVNSRNTNAKDLVLVCSNCHRMLHRRRPWLTIDELASLLNKRRFAGN